MSDLLRKNLAPLGEAAWAAVEEEARRCLRGHLSARSVVDVDGPHGWALSGLNLGSVTREKAEAGEGLEWGLRRVLPLVEFRARFELGQWDLDDLDRGGKTPDLDAVSQAAAAAAGFEERLVYQGFEAAGMQGLLPASPHKPVSLPADAAQLVDALESAVLTLQASGIGGPYALVAGTDLYAAVSGGDRQGYPLAERLGQLLSGGTMHWSPAVEDGVVLSRRGGDYELTLGQDLSIGYQDHGQGKVRLFLTESLAFRVLEPRAAVALRRRGA